MSGWDTNHPQTMYYFCRRRRVVTLRCLSLYTLSTRSQFYQKNYFPSSTSFSLHPFSLPIPVSTSLIPVYSTLSHVIFLFWIIVHPWPSSIKATLFLYYTSVLISTKIIDHLLPLRSPLFWPQGLMKLKDRDCPRAQHISWSLVLPPGQNHRTFTFPSEALATSRIPYQIPVWISS